jgi:cytochrome c oxidase assembly protein subunit 15
MAVSIRPTVFSRVAAVALAMLCVIVLTGALVRLTGSGLGCTDWPRCNEQRFVDVSGGHAAIEQLNRLFTGLVSASVVAAVLTAHLRRPRRRDLVVLAWVLVAGVLAQVVIGGIVVLTGLNPWANMAHFLVSMVLVGTAFALDRLSRVENVSSLLRRVPTGINRVRWALAAVSSVAVVTGTVVTATGPHAGDENAVRFGLALENVARVHGTSVVLAVAAIVVCMWRVRSDTTVEGRSAREALSVLAFVAVLQGAVGYTQYLTGVPVFLVAVHIAGATAFWLAVCNFLLAPRPDEMLPVTSVA